MSFEFDITFLIAVWGALTGTISSGVALARFRRDNRKLLIRVSGGYKIHPPNPVYTAKSYISITVTNTGRRPITITAVSLCPPKGYEARWLLAFDSVGQKEPKELSEGKLETYVMAEDGIGIPPNKYIAVVSDAAGRYYWSHGLLSRLIKLHRVK